MPKAYTYVDSKTLLSKAVKKYKDLYFYDDTHWSPIAAKLVAAEINTKLDSMEFNATGKHPLLTKIAELPHRAAE